ncbi:MAG: ATP-binding cassette domain-containing protein [Chloroflexota bacterium]
MPLLERTGKLALSVDPGEIVSVVGSPGTGKTRLGLELAFLGRPEEGEVLFRGEHGHRLSSRPKEIALLVQNAEEQLFARTLFDDIAFGPRHLDVDEEEIEVRVLEAIRAVGLSEAIRDRSPFALSGGERRRVALAGLLAMRPEVLILDEPTANLDAATRQQFLTMLRPITDRTAVVWLTNKLRDAVLADRMYLLRDGRALAVGRGDALRDWKALGEAGVELPGLYELAFSLAQEGFQLPATGSDEELRSAIVDQWRARNAG